MFLILSAWSRVREKEMDDWILERCDTICIVLFVHHDELRQKSSI